MWGHVRATLQAWYERYPDVSGDLRSRFRQDTPRQHVAAWWELYVYTLFDSLGYEVDVHPDADTGKCPDFLISREDDRTYVECMVLFEEESYAESDSQAWLFERINDVESADFMVDLTIEEVGTQRPSAKEIVKPIEQWLDSLDWQMVSERLGKGGEAPEQTFACRDWRIRLGAWPVRPDRRGDSGRLIGTYLVANAEPRRDEEQLRAVLAKKGSRYGPAQPLMLAILTWSSFVDERDVTNALFGSVAVKYFENSSIRPWMVRLRNGYWRPGDPPRGARVAGVLFGDHMLKPWNPTSNLPLLYINPWATTASGVRTPFGTRTVQDDGVIVSTVPSRSAADVLGISQDTFTRD